MSAPPLTRLQLAAGLWRAWRSLGRSWPPGAHLYRTGRYLWRCYRTLPRRRRARELAAAEGALPLTDNAPEYEDCGYVYAGLEELNERLARRVPVLLVGWHHGAIPCHDYALARALPQAALFTAVAFQYGKVRSIAMRNDRQFALFRMRRCLEDGLPVHYFVDGPTAGGARTLVTVFGLPMEVSLGPFSFLKDLPDLLLVPVTSYYRPGPVVEVTFHPPVLPPAALAETPDEGLADALVRFLERDLTERAPEQVLWSTLVGRSYVRWPARPSPRG